MGMVFVWMCRCSGHGKLSSDVYCLDLGGGEGDDATLMAWSVPNLKGKGPSPRFDHCATLFPSNDRRYFTVFGGQDNTQIFREVHYLDVETLTWQEETGMSPQMFDFEVSACALRDGPNVACLAAVRFPNANESADAKLAIAMRQDA